jgi:hypothetical protein
MEKLQEKYKEYINNYCNRINAIENALRDIYPNKNIYIHKDNYEDFSHIFIDGKVLFSDGSIYSEYKVT